jgi:hypothetical protein
LSPEKRFSLATRRMPVITALKRWGLLFRPAPRKERKKSTISWE